MRAVNLMPGDDRAARALRAAGSGGIDYALLGGLAVIVVLAGLWATANKQISSRQAKADAVTAEAVAAEGRTAKSAPYESFAALADARLATVTSLSATRFDWDHSLRELSRVLPDDVWLTSLDGKSGATSSAAPSTTASAAPAPTFEFVGCTGSQGDVARLMARLRSVDGVRDVSLKSSEKPDADGGLECPKSAASDPQFTIVIAFKVPGSPKDAVDATGQAVSGQPAAPATAVPAPTAATPGAPAAPTAGATPGAPPTPASATER
jgi:Tfp pilus assembly protein PilN